jgi:hypothetical protein
MATTAKNAAAAETAEVVEEKSVPHQAKVTSITKDDGEKVSYYGADDDNEKLSLVEKAKRLVKDKRVIAGATSVALLSVGVLIARKRNTVDENDETPAEA